MPEGVPFAISTVVSAIAVPAADVMAAAEARVFMISSGLLGQQAPRSPFCMPQGEYEGTKPSDSTRTVRTGAASRKR